MKGPNRIWWLVLALAGVAIIVAAAVLAINLTAQRDQPPATPERSDSAAKSGPNPEIEDAAPRKADAGELVPSAADIGAVVGLSGLVESSRLSQLAITKTDRPECGGVFTPAMAEVYADKDPASVALASFRLPSYESSDAVIAAVVVLPDATAAADFVAQERDRWKGCERAAVNETPNGADFFVGPVEELDGVLQAGGKPTPGFYGWACQRALTAADDAVVDVKVCNFGGSEKAGALATHIADRARTR